MVWRPFGRPYGRTFCDSKTTFCNLRNGFLVFLNLEVVGVGVGVGVGVVGGSVRVGVGVGVGVGVDIDSLSYISSVYIVYLGGTFRRLSLSYISFCLSYISAARYFDVVYIVFV